LHFRQNEDNSRRSYLTNLSLPSISESVDRLGQLEKACLAEVQQVRSAFGGAVWPGFGETDIPIAEYNQAFAFLVGYPEPPAGWVKVPDPERRGQAWIPTSMFSSWCTNASMPSGANRPRAGWSRPSWLRASLRTTT
jgi:hypothetical protein